jgi:hypothetical protein
MYSQLEGIIFFLKKRKPKQEAPKDEEIPLQRHSVLNGNPLLVFFLHS